MEVDTFSACMRRATRVLGRGAMRVDDGREITVELKNGSRLAILIPQEETDFNKPKLTVYDCEFLVDCGVLREDKEGCLSGWVKQGVKAMEYTPDPSSVMCTQEVTGDGTVVAEMEFVWEAWDDLYDAIVRVHREAKKVITIV